MPRNPALTLPTFVGIGGHKCASTWLAECLREHPQVYVSEPKELSFFSSRFDKGVHWYAGHFRDAAAFKHSGEFTSHYLYDPAVPERIFATLGRVPIVVVVREPTSRAISQIKYGIRHGFIDKPVRASLSLRQVRKFVEEYPAIVERSLYADGLERFLRIFGDDKLLVLDQEECSTSPELVLQHLWRFLGVDESFVPKLAAQRVSTGINPKMMALETLRKKVFYLLNARMPRLITLSRRARIGEFYRRLNKGAQLQLSESAVAYLDDRFAKDWCRTQEFCWRPSRDDRRRMSASVPE